MTRPNRSRSRKKYVQDDEGTAKLGILAEAKKRKRRKFLDFIEGKMSKSKNESQVPKMMNPRDTGDRDKEYLQNLEEEKPAKGSHERQTDNLSIETITEICKRSLPTSSLSNKISIGSSAALRGQIRASHGKSIRRIRADQNRAAQLTLCSFCNKSFPNLSRVPGCDLFSCSVCRRKSKAVDPASSLSTDFQNHSAKSPCSGRKQQIYKRRRDIVGRTSDTPVKIDSSSEEEDAVDDVGSAMNLCDQYGQADLQCTVKMVTYPSRYHTDSPYFTLTCFKMDPEAIDILASDIQRLEPSEFLNDTIIDFHIRYIQREFLSLESGRRFHFFNSFFYKKLSSVAGKKKKKRAPDFSKILNWTRGINIFQKDYLIIPVHAKLHWSLAIICFPKYGPGSASHCERCILHLDSMTCGHESRTVFRLLRRYLVAKWKDTYGGGKMEGDDSIHRLTCNIIPGKKVPVPLQENASDCGLFLLHYIRKFVENAPRTMKISDVEDRLEGLDVFGRQWFSPYEASSLRDSIREQLRRLFAEQERAVRMSSDTIVGIHEFVEPRNPGAEFREESVTCEAGMDC